MPLWLHTQTHTNAQKPFTGNPSNSPAIHRVFHSFPVTSPLTHVIFSPSPRSAPSPCPSHSHQFSDSYREQWRSECVCLIVCHENGISVDGWRDSGGEMQSKGKQQRKGWIVIVRDFLSPRWGSSGMVLLCLCLCVCVCVLSLSI